MSTEQSTVEGHSGAIEGLGGDGGASAEDRLLVTDTRTGRSYELPITDGTVRALDLRQIKIDDQDFGLMAYDPAFMNTASCRSSITYIDGDAGILQHRGYSIEQLCEHSSYLEVAYLLINGELPTLDALAEWVHQITIHTFVHENIREFMQGFRYDANPMGMLVASVGALSTFYPDANRIERPRHPHGPDHQAAGEDAHARRLRLPPQHGPALRVPRQRPRLRQQLPLDDVQDDRAQIRARSAPGPRARRALHPARRPRTERLHERRAQRRLDPGRPLQRRRRGRGRAVRAAARGSQRGRPADAAEDRQRGEHPLLPGGREGGQRAPDGLRPPRLQELRPPRPDHPQTPRRRVRRPRQEPPAGGRQPSSRSGPSTTSTSPRASCTRTSTSTPA